MSLSATEFWALAALAEGRGHGYGIVKRVERLASGEISLRVPTLYATLERLERRALVAVDGDEVADGRLRRYFAITPEGRDLLRAEVKDMRRHAELVMRVLGPRQVGVGEMDGPGYATP